VKLLHTADIHLGTTTYGRVDPEAGVNSRLLDFERSFEFMVERALDEDVDAFIFAGDAYRTPDPSPTQQRVFARCLQPLADAGIPIVMIVGNHDHPVSFGKASSIDIFQYVTGDVHLFAKPGTGTVETASGPLQVVALPWPVRSRLLSREEHRDKSSDEVQEYIEKTYLELLRSAADQLDPGVPAVLVGHLTVQGSSLAGSERTSLVAHEPVFTPGQLAREPLDYVALGHIHKHQDRNPNGDIPVVYSSSIERVSFKEWDEDKGFVLVNIDASGEEKTTGYEFVETPARPYASIRVDAREADDPTAHIVGAIGRVDVADAIVRVGYRIHEKQAPEVDHSQIREALGAAQTIASIEREVEAAERRRRTEVRRESRLEDALGQYVDQRDELSSIKDDLIEAGLELEAELEEGG
jgi:exonuclease SbcD